MTELYLQNSSVEAAALQEETILFDSKQNKFCMLNRTASFIWACLRSPASAEQVAAGLRAQFEGVSDVQAIEDAETILNSLVSMGLVNSVSSGTVTA